MGRRVADGRRPAGAGRAGRLRRSWRSGSGSAGRSSPPWPPSVLGWMLLARQGTRALADLRERARTRRSPGAELGNAGLVAAGGLLMVLPGFIGDLIGLLCLLPGTRNLVRGRPDPAGGRAAARRPAAAGPGARASGPPRCPAPTTSRRAVRQHPAGHRGRGRARPRRAPADLSTRQAGRRRAHLAHSHGDVRRPRRHAGTGRRTQNGPGGRSTGAVPCRAGVSWRGYAGRGARRGARRAPLRGPPRNDARGACPSGCAAA